LFGERRNVRYQRICFWFAPYNILPTSLTTPGILEGTQAAWLERELFNELREFHRKVYGADNVHWFNPNLDETINHHGHPPPDVIYGLRYPTPADAFLALAHAWCALEYDMDMFGRSAR
jgi:hypothetical protein